MRLMVGTSCAETSVPLVDGDIAKNLSAAYPGLGSDLFSGLIASPELSAQVARDGMAGANVALADVTPALPVDRPPKITCLGLNYVDHVKEGGYDISDYPALFMRSRNSMIPAQHPMIRPACSERLDYEVELMLAIGKGGRHIPEASALDHVFGYTVFNDGSVRDFQRKTHQWTPGKNFDNIGAVGPIVVTPNELPAGATGLKIESRAGTEILQSANTSDMMWPVAKTIAIHSDYTTLEPGDLTAMGTPPGVGHAKKPPRWLRSGETIEVEIEGIGICAKPVVDEANWTRSTAAE